MIAAMLDGVAVGGARSARSRRPVLTAGVLAVTVVISVAAMASPVLMHLFVRNLPRLQAGQWWRIVTPILVQPSGWGQLAFNAIGIAVVGAAVQRRFGWASWSVIYLTGGCASIAVYSAWHPTDTGGGSSAAVAALIGAFLLGRVITDGDFGRLEWFAEVYSVFFAVYLATLDLAGVTASIIAGNAAIILMVVARHAVNARTLAWGSFGVTIAASVAMIFARDDHGVGLAIGVLIAGLVLTHRWSYSRSSPSRWRDTAIAVPTVAVAAVLTWVAWVPMLGISLSVRGHGGTESHIGWLTVAVVAAAACLAASVALRFLRRYSPAHGVAAWFGSCLGIGLISVMGPVTQSVGVDALVALLSLHLVCTAAIIGLLAPSVANRYVGPSDGRAR